jgi:hypothetical protein
MTTSTRYDRVPAAAIPNLDIHLVKRITVVIDAHALLG